MTDLLMTRAAPSSLNAACFDTCSSMTLVALAR